MGGLLRLTIPPCRPVPTLGGREIVGGIVALSLDLIRARMASRRDHLAERYRLPPDPAALPAEWTERRKQERLRSEMGRHQEYLRLAAAVAEIEDALRCDAHLEQAAVLFLRGSSVIERWSGLPILERQLVWAECRGCDRRYTPEECVRSDWSRVADPRAGIGGGCLACPVGHVLFALQTWVA
jgi:hypothetical protein